MSNIPIQYRFIPPGGLAKTSIVNGRTYSAAANGYVDVPVMDAFTLSAEGWCQVAGSGTTAQRPANPALGQLYHDNTLGYIVVFEGAAWRQPSSGSTV
jgi:hypothetical protein